MSLVEILAVISWLLLAYILLEWSRRAAENGNELLVWYDTNLKLHLELRDKIMTDLFIVTEVKGFCHAQLYAGAQYWVQKPG